MTPDITISKIESKDDISRITLEIMHSLPEWFSPPEDIDRKAVIHRDFPFFAAFDGQKAVGFAALKIHNQYTADIYDLGVLREYHRCGIGGRLIDAAEDYLKQNGFVYLTVKTLDSSADYEPYNSTREFYYKNGFLPLEVFTTFWDEENPCLFLVKPVK